MKQIQHDGAINPTLRTIPPGVHVEIEPFGSPRPGMAGAAADTGAAGEGAYVEFDLPGDYQPTPFVGPRNTAVIVTTEPLLINHLNPKYVIVKRWWNLWYSWIRKRQ